MVDYIITTIRLEGLLREYLDPIIVFCFSTLYLHTLILILRRKNKDATTLLQTQGVVTLLQQSYFMSLSLYVFMSWIIDK